MVLAQVTCGGCTFPAPPPLEDGPVSGPRGLVGGGGKAGNSICFLNWPPLQKTKVSPKIVLQWCRNSVHFQSKYLVLKPSAQISPSLNIALVCFPFETVAGMSNVSTPFVGTITVHKAHIITIALLLSLEKGSPFPLHC